MLDSPATYTPGISERRGGVSKFYHPDHLGSTRGITNTSQAATDSMLHDAFGSLVSRTGTTPTPFGYVGQQQYQSDVDSGLMLLGHRYYDPYTGRFITQDPIGDDRNWYGYVGNDPQNWVDPLGLQKNSDAGGASEKKRPKRIGLSNVKRPTFWENVRLKVEAGKQLIGGIVDNIKRNKAEIVMSSRSRIKKARLAIEPERTKIERRVKIDPEPDDPKRSGRGRGGRGPRGGGTLYGVFFELWIGATIEAMEESMRKMWTIPGTGT